MRVSSTCSKQGLLRAGAFSRGTRDRTAQIVRHRLSSRGAPAQAPRGIRNLPAPGTEPMSPALAHGCLTTGQAEKSRISFYRASIDFIIMLLAYTEKR